MRKKMMMLALAGCLVVLGACGQADGAGNATADVVTGTASAAAGTLQLPRSVRYAGLTWTITAANADARSADEGSAVRLDFTVASSLDRGITYPASALGLTGTGVPLIRADDFLLGSNPRNLLMLGAGEQVTGAVLFEAPDPVQLPALSFTIDVEGDTPGLLPLSGQLPPDPYPLVGSTSGRSGPIADWEGDEAEVVVEARTATAALDYGADRAPRDAMFVIVGVRVFGVEGTSNSFVNDEFFRLRAAGLDIAPTENFNVKVQPGTSEDIEMAFPVPLEATKMTLLAGQEGTLAATFAVSIPR